MVLAHQEARIAAFGNCEKSRSESVQVGRRSADSVSERLDYVAKALGLLNAFGTPIVLCFLPGAKKTPSMGVQLNKQCY